MRLEDTDVFTIVSQSNLIAAPQSVSSSYTTSGFGAAAPNRPRRDVSPPSRRDVSPPSRRDELGYRRDVSPPSRRDELGYRRGVHPQSVSSSYTTSGFGAAAPSKKDVSPPSRRDELGYRRGVHPQSVSSSYTTSGFGAATPSRRDVSPPSGRDELGYRIDTGSPDYQIAQPTKSGSTTTLLPTSNKFNPGDIINVTTSTGERQGRIIYKRKEYTYPIYTVLFDNGEYEDIPEREIHKISIPKSHPKQLAKLFTYNIKNNNNSDQNWSYDILIFDNKIEIGFIPFSKDTFEEFENFGLPLEYEENRLEIINGAIKLLMQNESLYEKFKIKDNEYYIKVTSRV